MAENRLYDILLSLPLFLGMSRNDLHEAAGKTRFDFLKVPEGEAIVKDGERCLSLFFLLTGEIKVMTDADDHGYNIEGIKALAMQFRDQDYEVLLYDPQSNQNRRGEFVANLVKESGAQGLVLFMQQFCDPEEMEYPYLKKALDAAGVPHIKLGIDQQMRDFGQARTAIQAFADVLSV